MANLYDHWEPIPVTVNHYANGEWSVTGIPIDRHVLSRSLYHYGHAAPNYPVPARIVTFDYWPAHHTDNGKPALYGHDHYKPGRWLEFLEVN